MTGSRLDWISCGSTDQFSIQIQLYFCCIGVNINWYVTSWNTEIFFIPTLWYDMKCLFIFSPLASIEIEGILLKSCRIDYSKVRGVWYSQFVTTNTSFTCSVPRCWLTNIVKSCPDKFTGYKVIFNRIPPGFTCCISPAYRISIVRCTLIITRLTILWQCCVDTSAVTWWSSLRSNNFPIWMSTMNTTHSCHRIVCSR